MSGAGGSGGGGGASGAGGSTASAGSGSSGGVRGAHVPGPLTTNSTTPKPTRKPGKARPKAIPAIGFTPRVNVSDWRHQRHNPVRKDRRS